MPLIDLQTEKRVNIETIFLCAISAMIPFAVNMGNIPIILAVSFHILFFQKENLSKVRSFSAWFLLAFFLISALSGVFSRNTHEGLKHLDLTLLLVLFAIVFMNTRISKEVINRVLLVFYWASVISVVLLLAVAAYNLANDSGIKGIVFHEFTALYDQHPVYYSMYLSICLFYSLVLKRGNRSLFKIPLMELLANGVLGIGLILCASKAVLFFDLLAFSVILWMQTRKTAVKIVLIGLFAVVALAVFKIPFLNERFNEGLRFNESIAEFQPTNQIVDKKIFTYDEKTNISDLELRYIFWSIGIYHLTDDQELLFGYGQGDWKDNLNYHYFSYNLGPNWYENRNVHNQYLHYLISYGVFVLIFFLIFLVYSFKLAIRHKNSLHLFFLLLTCFVFIFEVVLVRNKGIIFFYFFNSLLLFNYLSIENRDLRNQGSPELSWGI